MTTKVPKYLFMAGLGVAYLAGYLFTKSVDLLIMGNIWIAASWLVNND